MPNTNVAAAFENLVGAPIHPGDVRAMGEAVVAWLNAHGGYRRHEVRPLFYERSLQSDTATEDQAICTYFTQDNHAIAVVDVVGTTTALGTCMGKGGTAMLGGGVGVWDDQDLQTMSALWSPYGLSADLIFPTLVKRLHATGWFAKEDRIGLIVQSDPEFVTTFQRVRKRVKSTMGQLGREFAAEAELQTANSSQANGIVLQFKSAGVTKVVIIDTGATVMLTMGPAMQSQNYYPELSVTSIDVIGTAATVVSPQVLDGAAGIGWVPAADAAPNRPGPTTTEALCRQIYRDAGVNTAGPLAAAQSVALCDGFMLGRTGYARAEGTNLRQLAASMATLGSAYVPAASFENWYAAGVYTGVAAIADVVYNRACSCFRYASRPIRLPRAGGAA